MFIIGIVCGFIIFYLFANQVISVDHDKLRKDVLDKFGTNKKDEE